MCGIFAGYPASTVAAELRSLLVEHGAPIVGPVVNERDPLEVLRYVAVLGQPNVTRWVEDALRAAELAAIRSAKPTPYAREVIVAARQSGRQVAIVSNNSEPAIRAYLDMRRLTGHVRLIVGRAYADPSRMKPNPEPLVRAAHELGVQPSECVLVGDSASDVEAAHAAGCLAMGYANKPGKHARLTGAEAVIDTMADLATALLGCETRASRR